ncbi:hypothetical protein Cgig2_003212 [Carnegiea gigantea]|uniref:Uncharacterized protein n=1 Tax=Carnegiea gigantea TaxID=171969 RepID=A0A9Q1QCD7_9CARY|nr:hypothetical protein Cgig2_003212 [Carnegiea gigantea]
MSPFCSMLLSALLQLFRGLEAFGRKPTEKKIVQKVADAYEQLGLVDEKERIMEKYADLFRQSRTESDKKSKRVKSKIKALSLQFTTLAAPYSYGSEQEAPSTSEINQGAHKLGGLSYAWNTGIRPSISQQNPDEVLLYEIHHFSHSAPFSLILARGNAK